MKTTRRKLPEFTSLRFTEALRSWPDQTDGAVVFTREGSCVWGKLGGSSYRSDFAGGRTDETTFVLSEGAQAAAADGWSVGGALGYQRSADLSGEGLSRDGDRFHVGATLKRELGATTLSASVSGAISDFSLSRQVIRPARSPPPSATRTAAGSPPMRGCLTSSVSAKGPT